MDAKSSKAHHTLKPTQKIDVIPQFGNIKHSLEPSEAMFHSGFPSTSGRMIQQ